jgi:hypothetical protein
VVSKWLQTLRFQVSPAPFSGHEPLAHPSGYGPRACLMIFLKPVALGAQYGILKNQVRGFNLCNRSTNYMWTRMLQLFSAPYSVQSSCMCFRVSQHSCTVYRVEIVWRCILEYPFRVAWPMHNIGDPG